MAIQTSNGVCVARSFGSGLAWRDIEAVLDPPAEAFEPGECGLFDDGFGEAAAHPSPSMIDQTR
jgi:hypothetical protein